MLVKTVCGEIVIQKAERCGPLRTVKNRRCGVYAPCLVGRERFASLRPKKIRPRAIEESWEQLALDAMREREEDRVRPPKPAAACAQLRRLRSALPHSASGASGCSSSFHHRGATTQAPASVPPAPASLPVSAAPPSPDSAQDLLQESQRTAQDHHARASRQLPDQFVDRGVRSHRSRNATTLAIKV